MISFLIKKKIAQTWEKITYEIYGFAFLFPRHVTRVVIGSDTKLLLLHIPNLPNYCRKNTHEIINLYKPNINTETSTYKTTIQNKSLR